MTDELCARKIKVNGIVQGVGFRPFVFGLAGKYSLTGWVLNSSSGVDIVLNGPRENLDSFIDELTHRPPVLSRIDKIIIEEIEPDHFIEFKILPSVAREGEFVPISPDMSICPDCQAELFDPGNRRYRYPFINCTNCGPRFSIIKDIPYDRPFTTMASFTMCPECRREYEDPADRRFHAQPTACAECGPQVWFESSGIRLCERESALQLARKWLEEGKIIAVKGLGGFHLACDACNEKAVAELRARKKRSDKPFALMAFDLQQIKKFCVVNPQEEQLLLSPQHPIVLLKTKPDSTIAAEVAPGQTHLGFMLPYTPLHLLLLEPEEGFPSAFVMTSGNLSEEPVAYEDQDALTRLSPLADGFLMNDRPIHTRVDDSVYRVVNDLSYPIRRSRGYAPESAHLPFTTQQTLAVGAELKNTFCLSRDSYAFMSHHIGDLENYETLQSFETGVDHFKRLFRIQPELAVSDLHPDYLSTRYAQKYAEQENIPLIQVQHHHAHLAACLADNHWDSTDPVIGLTFDGTGLGTDGVIWGGEVLIGGYTGYQRRFHLSEMPLPGGDAATHHPARIALAYLIACGLEWDIQLPSEQALCPAERNILRSQIEHKINTPFTTSMGRLFDAVSALIGVRQIATYEGQAAIELESICDPQEKSAYRINLHESEIVLKSLLEQVLSDWRANIPNSIISARFHNGLAAAILNICQTVRDETSISVVAFSGGVWQNITLLQKTLALLQPAGFQTLVHHQVPTNDGGISLGQLVIAKFAGKN